MRTTSAPPGARRPSRSRRLRTATGWSDPTAASSRSARPPSTAPWGASTLQRPVVAITPTSTGNGYWLVASDGGIFSFGDSTYYGSLPGLGFHPAGSGHAAQPQRPDRRHGAHVHRPRVLHGRLRRRCLRVRRRQVRGLVSRHRRLCRLGRRGDAGPHRERLLAGHRISAPSTPSATPPYYGAPTPASVPVVDAVATAGRARLLVALRQRRGGQLRRRHQLRRPDSATSTRSTPPPPSSPRRTARATGWPRPAATSSPTATRPTWGAWPPPASTARSSPPSASRSYAPSASSSGRAAAATTASTTASTLATQAGRRSPEQLRDVADQVHHVRTRGAAHHRDRLGGRVEAADLQDHLADLEEGRPCLQERRPARAQPDGNAQFKGQVAGERIDRAQLGQPAEQGGAEAGRSAPSPWTQCDERL